MQKQHAKWNKHVTAQVKEADSRMYFVRQEYMDV